MALIAVAGVLMTSFMAVFYTRTAQNTIRHDFLDEVALVRDAMGKWVENNDYGAVTIKVCDVSETSKKILARNESESSHYASFADGTLEFSVGAGDADDFKLNLKAIKSIDLEVYVATDSNGKPLPNNGKLLKCTLTGYDTFGTPFSQTLIFALDSSGKFVNSPAE